MFVINFGLLLTIENCKKNRKSQNFASISIFPLSKAVENFAIELVAFTRDVEVSGSIFTADGLAVWNSAFETIVDAVVPIFVLLSGGTL